MFEWLQHAVVTMVAVGAAVVVCRRVFVTFRPIERGPGCASCPSARPPAPDAAPRGGAEPLRWIP